MPGIHLVRRRGSSMVPSEDRPQTAIPANARATRSWATLRASSMELLRQRQYHAERGAAIEFAFDGDRAVVLLDNAAGDRQAQAGAVGFGREKWFKHSTHVFRGNARSRVLDSDAERNERCNLIFCSSSWCWISRREWSRTSCTRIGPKVGRAGPANLSIWLTIESMRRSSRPTVWASSAAGAFWSSRSTKVFTACSA